MMPLRAGRRPMTAHMSVVLPAPLRPIRPTNFPVGTSRSTTRRIPTDWIATSRPSMRSTFRSSRDFSRHVLAHFRIVQLARPRSVRYDPSFADGQHTLGIAVHDLHVVLDEEHVNLLRANAIHDH